jgi:antirestriction protein ArdC
MTTTSRPKKARKKYDGPTAEEKICQALVELMEAGKNPWRKEWKAGGHGGHRNLITGNAYRGSNPILLEMYQSIKGHPLGLWCGAGQAKQKGWWPIKGSKAAYIVRPQLNKFTDEVEPVGGGEPESVTRQWTSFKPAAVFNVADLKGKDEESQARLDSAILAATGSAIVAPEMERHAAAEDALGKWEVDTKWSGDRAFYSIGGDTITMPERQLWLSQPGLYATWCHECIHSTGAEKRLNRKYGRFGSKDYSKDYAREELVAELGAFLMCNRLQISSDAQNHAAYLSNWAEVLKEGPKVLFKVLSDATKASNLILGKEVEDAE